MKRMVSLLLAAALLPVLLACGSAYFARAPAAAAAPAEIIKIGIYEPASGDNSASGLQETLGVQYAHSLANTVNIGGKDYAIKLAIVDNASSTQKGPAAAESLVRLGVSAVVGSYGSAVTIAASDVFAKAGIPVVCPSCTNPQVTQGNTNYYTLAFLDPFQGTVLANFAADQLEAKTVYCLAEMGDNYSVDLCDYFRQAFEALGGKVIYSTFLPGTTDFAPYLSSAESSGADLFFAPISLPPAENLIRQAAARDFAMPLLAGDSWDIKPILNVAKDTGLEIYITTYFDEDIINDPDSQFVQDFQAWINSRPIYLKNNSGDDTLAAVSVMSYDAYNVILEAIKAAGSVEPQAISAALSGIQHQGVSGPISFDPTGNALREAAFIKKLNTQTGKWEVVSVQTLSD